MLVSGGDTWECVWNANTFKDVRQRLTAHPHCRRGRTIQQALEVGACKGKRGEGKGREGRGKEGEGRRGEGKGGGGVGLLLLQQSLVLSGLLCQPGVVCMLGQEPVALL